MSSFDSEVFARELLGEAHGLVAELGNDGADVAVELFALRQDVEATLAALEVEKDGRRARALRDDLEQFLPARKSAILSAAASKASSDTQASLETALNIAMKAAVAVARAFVTVA